MNVRIEFRKVAAARVARRSWTGFAIACLGILASFPPPAGAADALDYYDIENVALPAGAFSTDAIAFFPDGRLVGCFITGHVYTLDVDSGEWKLFADGLHMPLGALALSFVIDNQGDWVGASALFHIREGGFRAVGGPQDFR